MVKRKLSRKELKEDEVLSFVQKVGSWFMKYWKPLVYGSLSVLGIFILSFIFVAWRQSTENHAAKILTGAMADGAVDQDTVARVASKYKSTRAGKAAQLLQALKEDVTDEARRKDLLKVLSGMDDEILRSITIQNVVMLYINDRLYREAEDFIQDRGVRIPEDLKLYLLGRIAESNNRIDLAKEHYDRVSEEFEDSPIAAKARMRSSNI